MRRKNPHELQHRQDYNAEQLYSGFDNQGHWRVGTKDDWEDQAYQGGKYSHSEVGGSSQDMQNPWQGTQTEWDESQGHGYHSGVQNRKFQQSHR